MVASTSTVGKGTTLTLVYGTSSTAVTVGQCKDFTFDGNTVGDIDITNTNSDDNYTEYTPGIIEGGTVSFDMVYTKVEWLELETMFQAKGTGVFTLTFTDSADLTFSGYLQSRSLAAPYLDALAGSVTVKVSGKPTYATS